MSENDINKGFLEAAARVSGATSQSLAEAKQLDQVENADIDTESLFAHGRRSSDSAIHRAVFGESFPFDLFDISSNSDEILPSMSECIRLVRERVENQTIYDDSRKVSRQTEEVLGRAGFWGMLISKEHGGSQASFREYARFLSQVAEIEPTVAGLGSVHCCIGAVDPLIHFPPQDYQVQRSFLEKLATGQCISAFALTEPGAGSDLTAVKTTATLDGDDYVVNGKKLFITNAGYGRTIGLVCLIDGMTEVLIVDLPDKDTETFKINRYDIWALSRAHNVGLEFCNFRVPRANLLIVRNEKGEPQKGKGLVIAYHGLNRGRVALCANSAGVLRSLLANIIPWARYRVTYKREIAGRQLVQRRVGEMASYIVGCEALAQWCAAQLDQGFRGEMECIIAKRFSSEALKHCATEYVMKTHGGRSFLKGHQFGDNLADLLAPCIYEGEGEMLSQKFYATLLKAQQKEFFAPIARKAAELLERGEIKRRFSPLNPIHLWLMREPLGNYGKWFIRRKLFLAKRFFRGVVGRRFPEIKWMPRKLRRHAAFAAAGLENMSIPVSLVAVLLQGRLLEEQCYLARLSAQVQDLVVILCVSMWSARQDDEVVRLGADILCEELRLSCQSARPGVMNVLWNLRYYRKRAALGKKVIDGEFQGLDRIRTHSILQSYEK